MLLLIIMIIFQPVGGSMAGLEPPHSSSTVHNVHGRNLIHLHARHHLLIRRRLHVMYERNVVQQFDDAVLALAISA